MKRLNMNKKILSFLNLFLCALFISFDIGCNIGNASINVNDADDIQSIITTKDSIDSPVEPLECDLFIFEVINNQKEFISVNEDGQYYYWEDYHFLNGSIYDFSNLSKEYLLVDIDLDGQTELMIDIYGVDIMVFDYQDGEVYGYQFPSRSIVVFEDGICVTSSAADICAWYTISFEKDYVKTNYLAEIEHDDYKYGGEAVSKEKFYELTDELRKKECLHYSEYSIDNIKKDLNIYEQTCVTSKGFEKKTLEVPLEYMDVVKNHKRFDVYKNETIHEGIIKGKKLEIESGEQSTILYSSVVDVQGDGIEELVLYFDEYNGAMILFNDKGTIDGLIIENFEKKRFLKDGSFASIYLNWGERDEKNRFVQYRDRSRINYLGHGKSNTDQISDFESNIAEYYLLY